MYWNFPDIGGSQVRGISDSGIEIFKADPVKSLVREICQNSLDARLDLEKPVEIEFKVFTLPMSQFPGRVELLEMYKQAFEFSTRQSFRKACAYFERMIPMLESNEIPVLRISDKNTKGLQGVDVADDDWSSPWFRLVRSVSSSDKPEGAMGEYGSGKLAAFACSRLQTVFYSTLINQGNSKLEGYEGVSKLLVYKDNNGIVRSDVGFFCEDASLPIMTQANFEEEYTRTEQGTDIYIMGFKYADTDWIKELKLSVLDDFLYALKDRNLIVSANGEYIDGSRIDSLINEFDKDLDPHTLDYYKLLSMTEEEGAKERYYSYVEDNDIYLKMAISEGFHKRVGIVRFPGMKIFNRGYISTTVPFAGLCIINGKKIGDIFGGMENIQHTQWSLKRYDEDPYKKQLAKRHMENLYKDFQALFEELKGNSDEGDIDPDIGDCLPDPFSEEKKEEQSLSDSVNKIGERRISHPKASDSIGSASEDGSEKEFGDIGTNGGESDGEETIPKPEPDPDNPFPGPFPGPIPEPNPNPEHVTPDPDQPGNDLQSERLMKRIPSKLRVYAVDAAKGHYKLFVIPKVEVKDGRLKLAMSAESDSYNAPLIGASEDGKELTVEDSAIVGINIPAGAKRVIDVILDYTDLCTLEAGVYGY